MYTAGATALPVTSPAANEVVMPPRPKWHHMLEESKRQALLAVDLYNRSGDAHSYADFVVHMHLAWLYLLHGEFEHGGVDYRYRSANGRFVRIDGEPKVWDLARCVRERYDETNPVRANLEFFIGLRNKIEHRFGRALEAATAGRAHALVLNYQAERVARFGNAYSLADELRFPIFLQALTPTAVEEQRRQRRQLPASVRNYIARYDAALDQHVLDDQQYEFRVLLVPFTGPRTQADAAVHFVNADAATPEELDALARLARMAGVLIHERQRDVANADKLSPEQARAQIEEALPFRLNMYQFTELWKHLNVRPPAGDPHPERTDPRYCLWDAPWRKHVYTKAWVRKCIDHIGTPEKFQAFFGREPAWKTPQLRAAGQPGQTPSSKPLDLTEVPEAS
jgi:hypothetical protein